MGVFAKLDGITGKGEDRPMKIWTNGGASTFEDRMPLDFDSNDVVTCNGIVLETKAPSMSMHQGAMNSVWVKDWAGNVFDAAGNMTESFEADPGMDSFGKSLNPVLELTGAAGFGGTTFMTGSVGCQTMPPNEVTVISSSHEVGF